MTLRLNRALYAIFHTQVCLFKEPSKEAQRLFQRMNKIECLTIDFFHVEFSTFRRLVLTSSSSIIKLSVSGYCPSTLSFESLPILRKLKIKSYSAYAKRSLPPFHPTVEKITLDKATDEFFHQFPNLKRLSCYSFETRALLQKGSATHWGVIIKVKGEAPKAFAQVMLEEWMQGRRSYYVVEKMIEEGVSLDHKTLSNRYSEEIYPIHYACLLNNRSLFEKILPLQLDLFLDSIDLTGGVLKNCYALPFLSPVWVRDLTPEQRLKLLLIAIRIQFQPIDYCLNRPETKKVLEKYGETLFQRLAQEYKAAINLEDLMPYLPSSPSLYVTALLARNEVMIRALLAVDYPISQEAFVLALECSGEISREFAKRVKEVPRLDNSDLETVYHKAVKRKQFETAKELLSKEEGPEFLFPDKEGKTAFEYVYREDPVLAQSMLKKAREAGYELTFVKSEPKSSFL